MADNAYQALEVANGGYDRDQLLSVLVERSAYVLAAGEDTQSIDLQGSTTLRHGADIFVYDPADATSEHDGVTVLVDENGRRYHLGTTLQVPLAVLSRIALPPASPNDGDAHLITSPATGVWAGRDDDIAVFVGGSWKFIGPRIGAHVLDEASGAFYHYTSAGVWTGGLGALTVEAKSITPVEQLFPAGISIEAQQNTAPLSPANGRAWLVGASPTGVFNGRNDQIAVRRNGTWEYVQPYSGARIWNKSTGANLTYIAGAWTPDTTFAAMEFIDEYSASEDGSAQIINFTGLADFIHLRLLFIHWNAAAAGWAARVSSDDGSNYDQAGSDYVGGGIATSYHFLFPGVAQQNVEHKVEFDDFNQPRRTFMTSSAGLKSFRDDPARNDALRVQALASFDAAIGNARLILLGMRG